MTRLLTADASQTSGADFARSLGLRIRTKEQKAADAASVPNARGCAVCGGPISYGAAATCRQCYLAASKLAWGANEGSYTTWIHGARDLDVERYLLAERTGA